MRRKPRNKQNGVQNGAANAMILGNVENGIVFANKHKISILSI